eukprot:12500-Heterococcus_DN1.PRE.2
MTNKRYSNAQVVCSSYLSTSAPWLSLSRHASFQGGASPIRPSPLLSASSVWCDHACTVITVNVSTRHSQHRSLLLHPASAMQPP